MRISLLVPTRGRPNWMNSVWQTAYDTCKNKNNLEICYYIDEDDWDSQLTVERLEDRFSDNSIKYIIGPRCIHPDMYNRLGTIASGSVVWIGGDDIFFLTLNWDETITEIYDRFEDQIILIGTIDGYQGPEFATHPFISRKWTETLGFIARPIYPSLYTDNDLCEMAHNIGRFVQSGIKTDHQHFCNGKRAYDATSAAVMGRNAAHTRVIFQNAFYDRVRDSKKLYETMGKDPETLQYRRLY